VDALFGIRRSLYAIGGNPEAARAAGIPIERRTVQVFMIHGAFAGLATVLFATQLKIIQSTVPPNLELTIITAAVIGGVSILGGTGTVIGSTLAAILFSAIGSALIFINVSAYWLRAVIGALILITVLVDMLRRNRRARSRTMSWRSLVRHETILARLRGHRARRALGPIGQVLHRRQPAQPGPADDRGGAHRRHHDLRHRHRRHRPVGRLDPRLTAILLGVFWKNLGLPLPNSRSSSRCASAPSRASSTAHHHALQACRR
jgi:hypothetical protein